MHDFGACGLVRLVGINDGLPIPLRGTMAGEGTASTMSVGIPDVPILDDQQDEQGLRVADYAEALAEFIQRTETPMTIGIQGDWGSGKTSLMNLIARRLGDTYFVVNVNTWKYAQCESGEGLSIAVFLGIIHQLSRGGKHKAKEVFSRVGKALVQMGGKFVAARTGVEVLAMLEKGELEVLFERYEAMERLKSALIDLVSDVVENKRNGDRVVVFVDDLDRIAPERAVEILEVLKNFLDIPHLVFVLACDYEVVVKGLKARNVKGGEEVSGRSFFDKIIQVPFQMPYPNHDRLENYLTQLLKRVGAGSIEENDTQRLNYLLEVSTGTNPRTIKRLVNIMNLLLIVLDSERHTWDDHIRNKPAIVLALVALQNALPELYRHLTRRSPAGIFEPFTDELIEATPGLQKLMERKKHLTAQDLNYILDTLKDFVHEDGNILYRFMNVSDIAAVEERDEEASSEPSLTKFASAYIRRQDPELQKLFWLLVQGVPGDLICRREQDYIYFPARDVESRYLVLRARTRAKRVDVIIAHRAGDPIPGEKKGLSWLQKMESMGCPNATGGYRDFFNPSGRTWCHVSGESSEEQVAAVADFVRWYLLEAPPEQE